MHPRREFEALKIIADGNEAGDSDVTILARLEQAGYRLARLRSRAPKMWGVLHHGELYKNLRSDIVFATYVKEEAQSLAQAVGSLPAPARVVRIESKDGAWREKTW